MACGILVPRPGIEPSPPALEAQSVNHWTAREVPIFHFLTLLYEDNREWEGLLFEFFESL